MPYPTSNPHWTEEHGEPVQWSWTTHAEYDPIRGGRPVVVRREDGSGDMRQGLFVLDTQGRSAHWRQQDGDLETWAVPEKVWTGIWREVLA